MKLIVTKHKHQLTSDGTAQKFYQLGSVFRTLQIRFLTNVLLTYVFLL